MSETQTISPEILNVTEDVTFTPLEWKYFVLELKDMLAEGKFDLPKVIRAARFYAELERRDQSYRNGHYVSFTDEEWENFTNDRDCEVIIAGGHKIKLTWDDEAKVWIVTSDDIPGLILEDESSGKLIQRAIIAASELSD